MMRPRAQHAVLLALGVVWASASAAGLAQQRIVNGVVQPPDEQVSQPATAAVSGVVVDAGTHAPIGGAVVMLGGMTSSTSQMTDAQGRFAFQNLPPGTFALYAQKLGYIDGSYGGETRDDARRFTLATDQWFRDVRIALSRSASINGTVLDEDGEPVVGAYVRVLTRVMVGGEPQFADAPVARTDDRGQYRIWNLRGGAYAVMVPSVQITLPLATAPARGLGTFPVPPTTGDRQSRAYLAMYYPTARRIADASIIDLGDGEDKRGIDFHLQAVPVHAITGRVDGPPDAVSGLPLRLLVAGDEGQGAGSETATTITGTGGRFVLANVPAGNYTLQATPKLGEWTFGGESQGLDPSPVRLPWPQGFGLSSARVGFGLGYQIFGRAGDRGANPYWGRVGVVVGEGDVDNVTMSLRQAVSVTGHVVLAEGGDPPHGQLTAEPATGDMALGLSASWPLGMGPGGVRVAPEPVPTSGDAGVPFVMEGLMAGEYVLRASTFSASTIKSVTWNGRDYTDRPLDTADGRDITDVVVTLTDRIPKISGSVRDGRGAPVTNAAVLFFPADRSLWKKFGMTPLRLGSVAADDAGTYTINSPLASLGTLRVPAGSYYLVAVPLAQHESWQEAAFLEAASRVATAVTVGWGEAKTQDLVLQDVKK